MISTHVSIQNACVPTLTFSGRLLAGTVTNSSSPAWPGTGQEPRVTGVVTSYCHDAALATRFCSARRRHVSATDHCNQPINQSNQSINQSNSVHNSLIVSSNGLGCAQWLNCPATGGGSLSLKLLDYTFVRLGETFRTSIKHSIPPCTRKVCFCSQLKYTEP